MVRAPFDNPVVVLVRSPSFRWTSGSVTANQVLADPLSPLCPPCVGDRCPKCPEKSQSPDDEHCKGAAARSRR